MQCVALLYFCYFRNKIILAIQRLCVTKLIEGLLRMASRKLSRSTTVIRLLPAFCWHLRHHPCASWSPTRLCEIDKVCDLTHFASGTKKCRNFGSIISQWSYFELQNNNKLFSSMSQSQSIVWIKQKLTNNCQTTRIVTKILFNFFDLPGMLG